MKITQKITAILIISAIIVSAFSFSVLGASSVNGSEVAKFAAELEGDCSGLVYYVLKNFGITFGHSTSVYNTVEEAKDFGKVIKDMSKAEEGDIVVWSGHAAVYLGNGKCVHAMNEKKGVIINNVEDFIDSKGVKNPSHFFIRPFDYAEKKVEEKPVAKTVTQNNEPAEKKLTFGEKIDLMFDKIADFIKTPFEPVINAIKK